MIKTSLNTALVDIYLKLFDLILHSRNSPKS